MLGIARHIVLKRLRLRGDTVSDDHADLHPSAAPGLLDELTQAERIAAIRAAIEELPAIHRDVVVLCDLQELDYASAAKVMQCPVGTVRSRLARARTLLLKKVSEGPQWATARLKKTTR